MKIRETIEKHNLDFYVPKGKWEIVLFEIDQIQIILNLGRFDRYS